ncbi:MAG: LETM1-related biofilm-associated protein [Flavobacteriaceae bacterium]
MNPSSNGWFKKLLKLAEKENDCIISSKNELYHKLKSVGFIYGSNVSLLFESLKNKDFNQEERCKINYILSLFYINKLNNNDDNFESNLKEFYQNIGFYKRNFFNGLIGDDIESIVHKRIQINNNIFSKNYSFFVTNFLLFIDILSYNYFLKNPSKTVDYHTELENFIREIIVEILISKNKKSDYEKTLINLLESSFRTENNKNYQSEFLKIDDIAEIERNYLLDLACMASWNEKNHNTDNKFFNEFKVKFQFGIDEINQSKSDIDNFYNNNKGDLSILSTQNLAVRFYEHSANTVKKLITRNSKYLFQELKESKELVKLLSESTVRNLTPEEQNKMQEQLMDILKSIPSLAIFLLPGGAILLPLFIKFIPKLLPSAFDENRIDEN